ncbi:MAG TPA: tetratricopeptide repeat protein, partial [Candidatus Thermoplasmatota archaeon]
PDYYLIDGQLARVALHRGQLDRAAEGMTAVLAFQESQGMQVHAERAVTLYELGRIRFLQERTLEAVPLFTEAIDIVQRTLGNDHRNRLSPVRELQRALVRLGAEPWEGEGAPAWEALLEQAVAVLEGGGHADEARALVDAVLGAGE